MFFGAADAHAVGEEIGGFPSWGERVLHEWTNRARVDPQLEMTACGAACGDHACYAPLPPYTWSEGANHAARFHSDEAELQNFPGLDHSSHCVVKPDIGTTYPTTCTGIASCACVGGCECTATPPNPTCGTACVESGFGERVSLFGISPRFEIMASASEPNAAFYSWLYESYPSVAAPGGCGYSQGPPTNGHRYALLDGTSGMAGAIGFGLRGSQYPVGDLTTGSAIPKIPSGTHYPRQAASVEAWANWYDALGPMQALVNVDGTCTPLVKTRGLTAGNAAYKASIAGVGSGCHRYFFNFKDSSGTTVTYPTTGSLGIGAEGACADWDSTRPPTGTGCNCTAQCSGKTCGDDGCGGSCGNCSGSQTCSAAGACGGGGGGDGGVGTGDGGGVFSDGGVINGDGGTSGDGGVGDNPGDAIPGSDTAGCGCRQGASRSNPLEAGALGSLLVLFVARRRPRARTAR